MSSDGTVGLAGASAAGGGPAPVMLAALSLTDFRNYTSLSMTLDRPLVAITGPNGAGKTNLLEAVSLLAPGRGLRRAAYGDLTRIGAADGWAVATDIRRNDSTTRIGTGTLGLPESAGRSRQVRINGAAAPADAMQEHLRMLWLTPSMDRLFAGPPGDRRRFLDRLVMALDPSHGRRVANFEKLMTSRNRLLEEGSDRAWLDAVEAELAESAIAVSIARRATIARLRSRIAAQGDGGGFPAAGVALEGEFEADLAAAASGDLFADDGTETPRRYREALREGRVRDRAAGRALLGPHRSDLAVTFAAKDMPASLSSTGEQKALLIGLVLAHADLVAEASGMLPVLLLDEVAAHLDAGRRAALFSRLSARGGQAMMTGTDAALFAALAGECRHISIDAGAAAGPGLPIAG